MTGNVPVSGVGPGRGIESGETFGSITKARPTLFGRKKMTLAENTLYRLILLVGGVTENDAVEIPLRYDGALNFTSAGRAVTQNQTTREKRNSSKFIFTA